MFDNPTVPVILAAALALLVLLAVARRARAQRARARRTIALAAPVNAPVPAAPAAEPPSARSPQALPHYSAPRSAQSGPSLKVGIGLVRLKDDDLLVSWNATNDGGVPVEMLWGAPQVQVVEGGVVQLLYGQAAPGAARQPLQSRTVQPGEIVSRSAGIPWSAAGPDLRGARVVVAVGYGPQEDFGAAAADDAAYQGWQRLAVSSPRSVPRT